MPEKKRPLGLSKSFVDNDKKLKAEEPFSSVQDEATISFDSETPGDDLSDLLAMFESAVDKTISSPNDIEACCTLFRAVIHECDRMLRVKDLSPNEQDPFPAEFHLAYGLSLKNLGELSSRAEKEHASVLEYLDASIDRLKTGLSLLEEDTVNETTLKLYEALGSTLIKKAICFLQDEQASDKVEELSTEAMNYLNLLVSHHELVTMPVVLNCAVIVHRFADLVFSLEKRIELDQWALNQFKTVSQDESFLVDGLMGMGTCHLSMADGMIEHSEDGKDVDPELITEHLQKAKEYFQAAESKMETPSVPLLCMLGETFINIANTLSDEDDDEESELLYQTAVNYFNKVLAMDANALPGQFAEFVKEWETEMNQEE